jgi:hypothetical protein
VHRDANCNSPSTRATPVEVAAWVDAARAGGVYGDYNVVMRLRTVAAVAAMALAALVGTQVEGQRSSRPPSPPAAGRAVPRVEAAAPFKVGEMLTYDVSWSSMLVAGTATVSVREKKPSFNSTAYYIVAEGRPVPLLARLYSLYYKMDALLESYTLLSQRSSLYAEEGADHRTATTRFDRPAKRAFFEEQSDTTAKSDFAIPAEAQDGLSTLYAVRTRQLKAGDRLTIPVADSGSLYSLNLTVGAPERIRVPGADTTAWGLKGFITDAAGQPVWDNIGLWISDDARRLPVKMQADLPVGSFVLALREAR